MTYSKTEVIMRRRRTAQQQTTVKPLRVVLLGKDGVGKSALTVRFVTRRFIGEYDQTLESSYRHVLQIENEDVYVDIMDTAGENTDVKIRRYTRRGDLFIILYSIVDRSSFDEARSIAKYIKDHRNIESMSMVLVATKKDLDHLRRVDIEEGIGFSNELECTFYEVSISEGYVEVQELLKELLKRVLSQKNDKRDTLKIPSISIKRSPSLERRKWGAGVFDRPKSLSDIKEDKSSPENRSPELTRKRKDSNNNVPEQLKSLRELNNSGTLEELGGTKHKATSKSSSPLSQRKKNPFSLEKVKGASSANKLKLPKIEDENKTTNQKKMFTLQRARTGSGNTAELAKSNGNTATDSSETYVENNDSNDVEDRLSNDKPKGPFLLNKLHSTSTDKLRSNSSHERLRATTSFGRMRSGFERTFGRKKAIYL